MKEFVLHFYLGILGHWDAFKEIVMECVECVLKVGIWSYGIWSCNLIMISSFPAFHALYCYIACLCWTMHTSSRRLWNEWIPECCGWFLFKGRGSVGRAQTRHSTGRFFLLYKAGGVYLQLWGPNCFHSSITAMGHLLCLILYQKKYSTNTQSDFIFYHCSSR